MRVTKNFFSERKKKINLKKKDFIFVTKETVIFCSFSRSSLLNPLIRILKSVRKRRRRNVQMVEEEVKIVDAFDTIKFEKFELRKYRKC